MEVLMGLIKCFECGTMVSEYAEKCPSCGCLINVIKEHANSEDVIEKKGICRYQGVEYNLSEVETLLNNNEFVLATRMLCDKLGLEPLAAGLFASVIEFYNNHIPPNYDEAIKQYQQHNKESWERKIVRCKYCGSTNVKKLGYWEGGWKSTYGGLQWHCNNCDSDF